MYVRVFLFTCGILLWLSFMFLLLATYSRSILYYAMITGPKPAAIFIIVVNTAIVVKKKAVFIWKPSPPLPYQGEAVFISQ